MEGELSQRILLRVPRVSRRTLPHPLARREWSHGEHPKPEPETRTQGMVTRDGYFEIRRAWPHAGRGPRSVDRGGADVRLREPGGDRADARDGARDVFQPVASNPLGKRGDQRAHAARS